MTIEYRSVGGSATASEGVLRGLVTPFNTWANIGDVKRGGFKERFAPGTFAKTLQEHDIVLINNHDTGQPMARTSIASGNGSLVLLEDPSAGLRAEAVPVQTTYARDLMALAEAGVVRGMSVGFEVIKDAWTDDAGNPSDAMRGTKRTVHEVRLFEVTTTAFPAYTTSELAVRDARGGLVSTVRDAGMNEQSPDEQAVTAGVCIAMCPTCGVHQKGEDGDGDSDADDQQISRASEPAESTPVIGPEELREYLRTVYGA